MSVTRRELLAGAGLTAAAAAAPAQAAPKQSKSEPFRYMLNTSTIREQKLSLPDEVDLAAKAGYHALEPWMRELQQYVDQGGSLKDLAARIRDRGLTVESAIGFAEWIVDDPARRAKGLEQARRDMELLVQIGGKRIAAPPVGATNIAGLDMLAVAERYRKLCEIGQEIGVVPQVELWGFSKTLNRLGEVLLVAIESQHPQACVLADIYHLYKGGSDFEGLDLMARQGFHVFHVNDYPASPPRAQIADAHRVYPGDGVAPLDTIFRDLHAVGFQGYLSLELFNPEYWKQDPHLVAKTGLEKTRAAVRRAMTKSS